MATFVKRIKASSKKVKGCSWIHMTKENTDECKKIKGETDIPLCQIANELIAEGIESAKIKK